MRRFVTSTILLVLFVAVQATVVSHLDLDAHSQDTPCALCVGAAVFGGANVASPVPALPQGRAPQPRHEPYLAPAFPIHGTQLARAPPRVS
jgi:hypothetical protein